MTLKNFNIQTETSSNWNELREDPDNTVATVSLTDLHSYTVELESQQGTTFDLIAA